MTDSPINYSLMNFDLRQDDCPLYFDIVIPLAQRQFGILLQHKKKSDIQLKIFIQKNHNETMRLHYVSPVYPPVVTPPLMDLMFDDGDDNEHLEDLRFNLFKWLICWERLGNLDLKAIPKEYFLEIMTLVIMKNHGIITTLEADIFLLTLKSAHLKLCTNEIQYPEVINSKAYRIAFIFIKIRSHVIRSFQIVGLCNYSVRYDAFIIRKFVY